jgi:hypothetical protein
MARIERLKGIVLADRRGVHRTRFGPGGRRLGEVDYAYDATVFEAHCLRVNYFYPGSIDEVLVTVSISG